jgi:hypothetical protein
MLNVVVDLRVVRQAETGFFAGHRLRLGLVSARGKRTEAAKVVPLSAWSFNMRVHDQAKT